MSGCRGAGLRVRPLLQLLATMMMIPVCQGFGPSFVFVSSPTTKLIYYAKLPSAIEAAKRIIPHMRTFATSDAGYLSPTGIAVYSPGAMIFVADPGASTIWGQPIFAGAEEGKLVGGTPVAVATGVAATFVAVDGQANIFYTDPNGNQLLKLDGNSVLKKMAGKDGGHNPQILYSANGPPAVQAVNQPRAIAVDNFFMYWTNGNNGYSDGAVLRGMEVPADKHREMEVRGLAFNAAGVDGMCLAATNLFYSADGKVYGMKKGGGTITVVTDKLAAPAGCAWDADGSVYVADSGDGRVYSFAGNTPNLYPRAVMEELEVPGATGVSIYHTAGARPRYAAAGLATILLCALSTALFAQ